MVKHTQKVRSFTVFSSLFDIKKERPKMDLVNGNQCSISIEISLESQSLFSLVTYKTKNLIVFHSAN